MMFKFIARIAKGTVRGLLDILPIPQIKDAKKDINIRKVLDVIRGSNPNDPESLQDALAKAFDILDDGQLNDSYDEKKVESLARITTGAIPIVAYIIYGITTGDWNIFFN